MTYGVTQDGFLKKTQEVILDEMIASYKAKGGQNSDFSEDSPLLIIFAVGGSVPASQAWDCLEDVYNSLSPVTATGVSLSNSSNFVGIERKDEVASTARVSFRGDSSTNIPSGTQVKQSATNLVFKTSQTSQITQSFCNWIQFQINQLTNSSAYTIFIDGEVYTYTSDASATYDEIVLGLKAIIEGANLGLTITNEGSGLLTIEATDKDDIYDISSSSKFDLLKTQSVIEVECLTFGANSVLANSIDTISTALSGLDSVINYYDGSVGNDKETDQELRMRRKVDISIIGFNFTDSIKSRISQIRGVSFVRVYENDTLAVDANGIDPKSFEAIVLGGSDQEIADTLYLAKIAGIKSFGTEAILVRDSDNIPHYIRFTRPDNLYIWVRVTINSYDPESTFPINGELAIKQSILNYGSTLTIGEDIILQKLYAPVFEVDGIKRVTIEIAKTDALNIVPIYAQLDLETEIREIPNFDITRIQVIL